MGVVPTIYIAVLRRVLHLVKAFVAMQINVVMPQVVALTVK